MKRVGIILIMFVFSSCATIFTPEKYPVNFKSQPEETEVYINGLNRGVTPFTLEMKPDKTYRVKFKKDGFSEVHTVIEPKLNKSIVFLDVVCGVVPAVIDAATQNWNYLDKSTYEAIMSEQKVVTEKRNLNK